MESAPRDRLSWPPKAEDLRRLYLDEHLSAAKIAERYGLQYASPKTAESTVLYHLKRNGITRRDKAEHMRRVTEEMVDRWVERYQAGESLKQIAANEFSPVTVFLHLRKRGVQPRDKVEAQIKAVRKFERNPFRGDTSDRAYILGFVWGDCSVERHGRAIRVKSGTTHPAFATLFKDLFASYGHVMIYAKSAKVTPAEWNMQVDLDGSFEFLLEKDLRAAPQELGSKLPVMDFVAGFADAEGSIYFHRHSGNFQFQISNTNFQILRRIQELLEIEGYRPRIFKSYTGAIGPSGRVSDLYQLGLYRPAEVGRLLRNLPLRHSEKKMKKGIALAFIDAVVPDFDDYGVPEGWSNCLAKISAEVDAFVQRALFEISHKQSKDGS